MLRSTAAFFGTADAIAINRRWPARGFGQCRPGLFQMAAAGYGPTGWRDRSGAWRVPLAVMLPAGMVISAGMWAAIALAVDALF